MKKKKLELDQIQGLVLSGYGERPAAKYVLFEIIDGGAARRWLGELLPELQFGEFRRSKRNRAPFLHPLCANLAFTHAGLAALGLHPTALAGFSEAFQLGWNDPGRARRLGDDGESAPEKWRWGQPGQALHGVLLVFAGRESADQAEWAEIDAFTERHVSAEHGLRKLDVLCALAADQAKRKEHFGFRDGIANPGIRGLSRRKNNVVAPGEVLLGYENGYGKLPLSPELPVPADPKNALPPSADPARRDFGKNGSYLVFRQLSQHVQEFWRYVDRARLEVPDAPPGKDGMIWLASKMVGRWPNGTPIARHPERPGPDPDPKLEKRDRLDDFLYGTSGDPFGDKCPIGSHVRRSNPRDTALPMPHDPELSGSTDDPAKVKEQLALSDLHRILRRGRLYGDPLDPDFDPEKMMNAPESGERGLFFLCVNANLSRQFEFVQSHWVNEPTFAGLSADPDPLLSAGRTCPFRASDFTMQGLPARQVHDVPRVVEVRGSAYFFLPSRQAITYLSGIE